VISPEGCASILWKSASKAEEAAQALGLTAERLLEHKLVDKIIPEPLGGAHRNPAAMAETLKVAIWDELQHLESLSLETLLDRRYQRLRAYGAFEVA
jgi:acetyl-CoA carboxylase carboxyl transferase subunit alpha